MNTLCNSLENKITLKEKILKINTQTIFLQIKNYQIKQFEFKVMNIAIETIYYIILITMPVTI